MTGRPQMAHDALDESNEDPREGNEDGILRARARALAGQADDGQNTGDQRRLVRFSLGAEHYAVDLVWARAILPLQAQSWTPVPGTPAFITGVVNVRGHIYSMIDVARYLGGEHSVLEATAHVVVVGHDGLGMELGLLTDTVPDIVAVPADAVQPAPADILTSAAGIVRGVMQDLSLVLDLAALLSDPGIVVDVMV